jgi:hypothetical protein
MKCILFLCIVSILIISCSDSTDLKKEASIKIEVFQNGVSHDSFTISEDDDNEIYYVEFQNQIQGEIEVDVFSYPSAEPIPIFFIIARKNDYFSIFNEVISFDTLKIDFQIDFDLCNNNLNCGTMYDTYDGLISNESLSVWSDSIFIDSLFTDDFGRFETEINSGLYILKSEVHEHLFETDFLLIDGYGDYCFPDYYQLDYGN